MKEKKREKNMFIFICILIFIFSFIFGIVSKSLFVSKESKKYSVKWSDDIGTLYNDISYGKDKANKFDLYLPKNNSKANYGLVVYLHAGGFTSGDKAGDIGILSWLCSKGYVAVGINYTLRTETNNSSILLQSNEIKQAIPVVIEEARKYGYNINEMAIAGGSAGHTLAMIYAYRDKDESPVPVRMTFGAVGPSSFYTEDWGIYGLDQDTDNSRKAAADLFGVMGGVEITPEMIKDGSYIELMKLVSALAWIDENTVPSVVAYGTYDKVQPYKAAERLLNAFKKYNVDYKFFELPHSGHGLQNDDKISIKWMQTVEDYLEKYMPTEK